jgi:hypothetical protein
MLGLDRGARVYRGAATTALDQRLSIVPEQEFTYCTMTSISLAMRCACAIAVGHDILIA